jgi:hypothetical protein
MYFASWSDFTEEFVSVFCPENEATTFLMQLKSDRYFQGKWNVEVYIDKFKGLFDLSGYTDPIAIVLKFCRGLNSMTQDRIAKSGTDRPQDTDFNGWFKAAQHLDLNCLWTSPHSLRTLADDTLHSPTHSVLLPPLTGPLHRCNPCSNARPFAQTSPWHSNGRQPHSDPQTHRANLLLLWPDQPH